MYTILYICIPYYANCRGSDLLYHTSYTVAPTISYYTILGQPEVAEYEEIICITTL